MVQRVARPEEPGIGRKMSVQIRQPQVRSTLASAALALAWICFFALSAITLQYLLLAVLPFYANGIHLEQHSTIGWGGVDAKEYPPFVWQSEGGKYGLVSSAYQSVLLFCGLVSLCRYWCLEPLLQDPYGYRAQLRCSLL